MEEEVRKWVKKRLQDTSASRAEELPEPAETQPPQDERKISAEGMWEKTEEEKPHEPSQEPPHSNIEKTVEAPQIKENLNIDTDFSKITEKERPQPLPEEKSGFSSKGKILLILVAMLLAFLAYWFYKFFTVKSA